MKTRLISTLSLLAVLVAACAPNASQAPATQPIVVMPSATVPPAVPTLEVSVEPASGPTQETAPTALPVATSRGSELEATDPSTVSLASGELHFVEFFRFT